MKMDITSGIAVGGIIIQFGFMVYKFGRQSQKLDGVDDNITEIKKNLNNGYTCKFHADMEKELGRLQGSEAKK